MEQLPPELLLEIFSYACVDGGYTGRSLSYVSRRINAVSESIRYQSLAVYGARHIETLSFRLYGSLPDSGLRKIRHLFLTDRSPCASTLSTTDSNGNKPEVNGADLVTNITCILSAIAPYLETLLLIITTLRKPTPLSLSVLSFLSDLPFLPVIPTDLPALRELTLALPLIPDAFVHSRKASRLERLHIATHTELPATFGQQLRRIAPELTHLRVSSLRGRTDGGGLPTLLKAFVYDSPSTHANLEHMLPRRLQRVIVTPKPATRSRGHARVFGTLAQDLEQICRDDKGGRVLVVKTNDCLKEDRDHEKVLYEMRYNTLQEQWLGRIQKERGCWLEGSGYLRLE